MKTICATLLLAFICIQLQAQTVKDSSLAKMRFQSDIDDFILTVRSKKHREWLIKFAKGRDSLTKMNVHRETNKFYEIWVDYRTTDGYNWGEGYTICKQDGTIEMIWHEQPFKSKPILIDSIPPKKAEKHS